MLTRTDIDWSMAPEPPNWLVDRLFVKGQVTLLAALGGGAKTLLVYDLAVALMYERTFLGRRTFPDTGRVLILDAEGDLGEVRSRLKALGMGQDRAQRLFYALNPEHQLGTTTGNHDLAEAVTDHAPDLVVIDSLSALAPGNLNDSDVALGVMNGLKALRSSGAAVIALAHETKPSREGASAISRVHNVFGSVQWINQSDAAFALTTSAETPQMKGRKKTYPLEWECVRSRAGLVGERGDIEVRSVHGDRGERLWMSVARAEDPWPPTRWDFTEAGA